MGVGYPYIYDELRALLDKAGIGIEDVYAVTFHSNVKEWDEGTIEVRRYLRDSEGRYYVDDNGCAATVGIKQSVRSIKRGSESNG